MMPVSFDLQRVQALELNDQIRRSSYSFEIRNNQLRIFPIPTSSVDGASLWFDYILVGDRTNQYQTNPSNNSIISNPSYVLKANSPNSKSLI